MPVYRIKRVATSAALAAVTANSCPVGIDDANPGDFLFQDKNAAVRRLSEDVEAAFFLPGATPATAANFGVCFFTAKRPMQLVAVNERHSTAGSDGGAVTAMVKKVPSGTAVGSGTDMLSAGISLKGTADTNAAGTLHGTTANLQLAAGDSLAVALTGTPTSLAGVCVQCWLKPITA